MDRPGPIVSSGITSTTLSVFLFQSLLNADIDVDVGVDVDQANDALSLSFSKGSERGRTLVDRQDADDCLDRGECLHLGVQVGQFVRNYCEAGCSCRI